VLEDIFEAEADDAIFAEVAESASPLLAKKPNGPAVKEGESSDEDVFGDTFDADEIAALDRAAAAALVVNDRSCPRTPYFDACSEDLALVAEAADKTSSANRVRKHSPLSSRLQRSGE